jgi:RNA polymerase sigma-70 factor, ECF subfamily
VTDTRIAGGAPLGRSVKRSISHPTAEQLIAEHYSDVLRLARSLCGHRQMAEDVAQEVFIAVIDGIDRFRGEARASTWIYRITVRIAGRMLAKRRWRNADLAEVDALTAPDSAEDAAELAELSRAIQRLPLASRVVLSLVMLQGLSHTEAAEVLGVPAGTIGSRLHHARMQLLGRR